MTKFYVYEENFEFRCDLRRTGASAKQIWDLYNDETCRDPEIKGEFDTIEEARAALAFVTPYSSHQRGYAFQLVVGRLGYIEEVELDEDGDIIQSIADWDIAVAELEPDSDWIDSEE